MTPTLTFTCSICGEPSVSICVYCTKDACPNHLCERCSRCSDCCECDVRLEEHPDHPLVQEHPFEHPMEQSAVDGVVTMTPPPLSPEQWAEPEAGHLAEQATTAEGSESSDEPVEAPTSEPLTPEPPPPEPRP